MGNGSTRVEYRTHTVYQTPPAVLKELEEQKAKLTTLEEEATKRKDPLLFKENSTELINNLAKELPRLQLTNFIKKGTGEHHIGFIGPVSAGKTSYINALFGLKLPVAVSHCTEDCSVVHKDGKNIIWDVFGSNDSFHFFDADSLSFVKDLDVCVLLFCEDPAMVANMLKVVYAINKNLIIIRTKCDLCSEDDARTIEEEKVMDGKKVNLILGTQNVKTYCISSRNVARKTGKEFDWKTVRGLMGLV